MTPRLPAISLPRRLAAAALTALAVGLTAQAATVLAFFISNGFATDAFADIVLFFAPATAIAIVLITTFAAFGAFRRWFYALATGIFVGVTSALLGTTYSLVQTGTVITRQWVDAILATIGGSNLIFVVALVVAAPTLGLLVWRAVTGLRAGTAEQIALVRLPATNLAEGEVTHIKRKKVDTDLADEQWDSYVDALSDNGWTVVEVAPALDLADSVFIEDTVVVFGSLAVITSPGAESRRDEITDVETSVRELGLTINRIELPGTLDGGDVLKVGSTVYVGRGGRTNAEGIRQLRAILAPLGLVVVAVPISKVLHLKSAVTALPDGTVIGYAPNVDDASIFDRFLAMPEESGSHVVQLSADTVLMAASAPRSAAIIADLGYRVVTVDISEFEKLEGCVTCLSVRIR